MTGDALLALAGKLVATYPGDEAACRAAISRCYYGAFHLANALLQELGFTDVGHDHGRVAQHLAESNHSEATEAGQMLSARYSFRRRADYDLSNARYGQANLARQCVERAHRVKALLDRCNSAEVKQQLVESKTSYRAKLRPRNS